MPCLIKSQMNDPNEFPSLYTDLHTKLAYTEITLQSDNRSIKDKKITKNIMLACSYIAQISAEFETKRLLLLISTVRTKCNLLSFY